jgi:hypothetical protein
MSAPNVVRGVMYEGSAPPPAVFRFVAPDTTALKKVDATYGIDSVDLRAYDAYDVLETIEVTKTLSGAGLDDVVFDTLQVDGYAFDNVGYNFRHQLTAAETSLFVGGRTYNLEYLVTPTAQPVQVHVLWLSVLGTQY